MVQDSYNYKRARELRENGCTIKEISEILGISVGTVKVYTTGTTKKTLGKEAEEKKMPFELQVEWVHTVNRIREYLGKPLFILLNKEEA